MKNNNITFDIETTGLSPWFGDRVTCICARTDSGEEYKGYVPEQQKQDLAELELIESFFDWVSKNQTALFISKNGKGFDIPFLCARASILNAIGWEVLIDLDHFDLQEITSRRISLNDMALLLGVEQKINDGLGAIKLWKQGDYSKLIEYCMKDVEITQKVYLNYINLKGVEK